MKHSLKPLILALCTITTVSAYATTTAVHTAPGTKTMAKKIQEKLSATPTAIGNNTQVTLTSEQTMSAFLNIKCSGLSGYIPNNIFYLYQDSKFSDSTNNTPTTVEGNLNLENIEDVLAYMEYVNSTYPTTNAKSNQGSGSQLSTHFVIPQNISCSMANQLKLTPKVLVSNGPLTGSGLTISPSSISLGTLTVVGSGPESTAVTFNGPTWTQPTGNPDVYTLGFNSVNWTLTGTVNAQPPAPVTFTSKAGSTYNTKYNLSGTITVQGHTLGKDNQDQYAISKGAFNEYFPPYVPKGGSKKTPSTGTGTGNQSTTH